MKQVTTTTMEQTHRNRWHGWVLYKGMQIMSIHATYDVANDDDDMKFSWGFGHYLERDYDVEMPLGLSEIESEIESRPIHTIQDVVDNVRELAIKCWIPYYKMPISKDEEFIGVEAMLHKLNQERAN